MRFRGPEALHDKEVIARFARNDEPMSFPRLVQPG